MTTSDKPAPILSAAELRSRMRFRQHRGSLEDSVATLVYIQSDLEFRHIIENILDPSVFHCGFPDQGVLRRTQIKLYADHPDDRIGWDKTWIVTVDGYGVVGFTDRSPTDLPMWT